LFETIERHISEEKEKTVKKKKKKASRKAGTVENARLFRQPYNSLIKILTKELKAEHLHWSCIFRETDRLNLPCFLDFD
jgi:hypothetical protein